MKSISSYSVQLLYGGISLIAMCGILIPELANAATITNTAPAITYGTYIEGSYSYEGPYSYNAFGSNSFVTPGSNFMPATTPDELPNYTNQIMTQADNIVADDPSAPGTYHASATASLSSNQLTASVGASNFQTSDSSAIAEMWDTLSLSHLPTGGNANTVVGTLNMQVHTYGGVPEYDGLPVGYTLSLYNPALFNSSASYHNCAFFPCPGFITASGAGQMSRYYNNGTLNKSTFAPVNPNSTTNLSIPITMGEMGELTNGNVAYIAAISGYTNYLNNSLSIDPSISLAGLYPGVTITSLSGTNYVAPVSPVPVPDAWVLMVSGLGLLGFMLRLKSGLGLIRNWDPIQNLA